MDSRERATPGAQTNVSFGEALRAWLEVAIYSFGGPAGQIAVMHRVFVDERRWISENRFLHALNYCMFLPGPEAQQLVTYIGWLQHRILGGLVAGSLFVLPGFIAILVLSVLYAGYRDLSVVEGLFFGIKPAVLAIVVQAVVKIGSRALKNRVMIALAATAFIAIFFLDIPFPTIVIAAAVIGFVGGRLWPEIFYVIRGHDTGDEGLGGAHTRPSVARAAKVLGIGLTFWLVPVLALGAWLGSANVFVQEGVFFSKAAVVTFGGAYAVLAYLAQAAVHTYGWLAPGEMLDGLGMAETTPGPLIQVVQFVGFMGAYRHPGTLDPMLAGVLASVLVTWVTFVPCFIWIFLGAPYIEALRGNKALSTALSGITAAVVGVVLNLAVWFALHTLFTQVDEVRTAGVRLLAPAWATLDVASVVLAAAAALALFWFRTGMLMTLLGSAVIGMVYHMGFAA